MVKLVQIVCLLGVGLSLMVAGCSPTIPAPVDPTLSILKPGRHVLQMHSFDFSSDPNEACEQPGVPRQGKIVHAFLMLQRVGDQWIATLAPGQSGGVTLTLRYSGERVSLDYRVVGTIEGEIHDAAVGSDWPGIDVRVRIRDATVEGRLRRSLLEHPFIDGRVTGQLTYSNSNGDASNCPAASWSFQPYGGT